MQLPNARNGRLAQINRRPVAFSFFPTYKRRRDGVNSILFVTDPWSVIRGRIETVSNSDAKKQSVAFFNQARDFFTAAQNADINAAKPLLLYYSFLNLAKCFIVQKRNRLFENKSQHGLIEKLSVATDMPQGHIAIQSHRDSNVFSNFAKELGTGLEKSQQNSKIFAKDFLAQILVGHRMFFQDRRSKERFINLDAIDYMYEVGAKEVWLRARAYKDDFTRLSYPLTSLSKRLSNSKMEWQNVKCDVKKNGREMLEAETVGTFKYEQTPSKKLKEITQNVKSELWRTVTSYRPYREYYIYQSIQTQTLLNQILIIYLATFGFSSISRYKPEQFESILKGSVGPFILEFFASQPSQFLYLMASEFMEQEVTKAAVI